MKRVRLKLLERLCCQRPTYHVIDKKRSCPVGELTKVHGDAGGDEYMMWNFNSYIKPRDLANMNVYATRERALNAGGFTMKSTRGASKPARPLTLIRELPNALSALNIR